MSARVLVVDDILPNVKLLEAKLAAEYYDVLTASNGPEALEKIERDKPDLVLLDVMMPGMDGFEVCQRIKSNPETSHIPVVMVTALTDATERVRGLESGADDFLSKPVNDTALMARVRSLVRLKMTVDEWRAREITATQLGVVERSADVMHEPVEGARILVVESHTFEAKTVESALEVDRDEVIHAINGVDAMKAIGQGDFDLIMVSLNLEKEDGLRLCSHLRSNEKTRKIPLLMIADEQDMPRVAQGLEMGAHDYILRPLDKNEMLARTRTQIRRKRFQEHLRSNYEMSLSMALVDSLTGLYNRRYFEVHLQKLLLQQAGNSKSLGILLLDIDHFKAVNDTHGHGVGDEVLKVFADRLNDKLRSFDLVARLGGEEFVVILPDVSHERAKFVAERLRRAICMEPVPCSVEGGSLRIATSIGGAVVDDVDHSIEEVLKWADDALYEAKGDGRNCTYFKNVGRLDGDTYKEDPRTKKDD